LDKLPRRFGFQYIEVVVTPEYDAHGPAVSAAAGKLLRTPRRRC